jgi:hypothetical protein
VLLVLLSAAAANGQCYIDEHGRRICPRQQGSRVEGRESSDRRPAWSDPTVVWIDGYTGTLVEICGRRNFVLTCGHGPERVGATCTVVNRFGYRFAATCIECDTEHDLAILELSVPAQYVAQIAAEPARPGARLTLLGFGGGRYGAKPVTASGGDGTNIDSGAGTAVPGDSGGPVKNALGHVVGVLSGTDMPHRPACYFSPHRAICAILARVRARLCPPGPQQQPPPRQQSAVDPCPSCDDAAELEPSCSIDQFPPGIPPVEDTLKDPAPAPEWQGGCDCGPEFARIDAELTALRAKLSTLDPQPSTLNFTAPDAAGHSKIIATAQITPGQTSEVKLPPTRIRVLDPRGENYSTTYQPFYLGQHVTLPFGPAKQ